MPKARQNSVTPSGFEFVICIPNRGFVSLRFTPPPAYILSHFQRSIGLNSISFPNLTLFPVHFIQDIVAALFHEPFRGAGGTTDADGLDAFQPSHLDFCGAFDVVAAGIALQALVEEYAPIATLTPRDEENQVVTLSEGGDGRHAVRHLSADVIEAAEVCPFSNMTLDEFYNLMEFI